MEWTSEKISALAPDASTEKRGKGLANTSKWQSFGCDGRALWGECKGSGSLPYLVKIDLQGPAFGCTCPIRKPPCKHVLGLFFLYAQQKTFPNSALPNWISEWIEKRDAKNKKQEAPIVPKSEEELAKALKAKEKRDADRLQQFSNGIDELEQWMLDLIRQGFANVAINDADYWEGVALKMKDAKLSRVSYFLKETGIVAEQSSIWTEKVPARLGELYLLIKSFRKLETLSPALQDEVFNTIGLLVKKNDVLASSELIKDHWVVLAKKEAMNLENVMDRRVWVVGLNSKKIALINDFAFGNMGFEQQYVVGTVLDASLAYYPASFAQRAVLEAPVIVDFTIQELPNIYASVEELLTAFADALALNPWLSRTAVMLSEVRPFKDEKENYFLLDKQHQVLELNNLTARAIWKILAISGGHPVTVIGEWSEEGFEPLSIYRNNRIEELN